MSDYLTNLAARTLAQTPAIRPRLGVFEPLRANESYPLEQDLVYETSAQPASPPSAPGPPSIKNVSPGHYLPEPIIPETPTATPERKPTSHAVPIEVPIPDTVQPQSPVATPVPPLRHPVTARSQEQLPEADHPPETRPVAPVTTSNPDPRPASIHAKPLRLDQNRDPGDLQSEQSPKLPIRVAPATTVNPDARPANIPAQRLRLEQDRERGDYQSEQRPRLAQAIAHPPKPASLLVTKPESSEPKQTTPARPLGIEHDQDAARGRPKSHQEPPLAPVTAPKAIPVKEVQTEGLLVVAPVFAPGEPVVQPPAGSKPLTSLASPRPTRILAQPQVKLNPQQTAVPATNQPVLAKSPPAVHVTIGRIEVRAIATQAPTTARGKHELRATVLSLDDYLKQRQGGTRR